MQNLLEGTDWSQKTVITFLGRLSGKDVLMAIRIGRAFHYEACITKQKQDQDGLACAHKDDQSLGQRGGSFDGQFCHQYGKSGGGSCRPRRFNVPLVVSFTAFIFGNYILSIVTAAAVGDFLRPKGDEHRRAFGGQGPNGVDFAQAVGQRRVQAAHLLPGQGGELAEMLSGRGRQGFRVAVKLPLACPPHAPSLKRRTSCAGRGWSNRPETPCFPGAATPDRKARRRKSCCFHFAAAASC